MYAAFVPRILTGFKRERAPAIRDRSEEGAGLARLLGGKLWVSDRRRGQWQYLKAPLLLCPRNLRAVSDNALDSSAAWGATARGRVWGDGSNPK